MSSECNDMAQQNNAEQLPAEMSHVLQEYFLKKPVAEVNLNNIFVTVDTNENNDVVISNTTIELQVNEDQPILPTIECEFAETESPLKSIVDIDVPQLTDTSKKQYFESHFGENGCGCELKCHTRFSMKAFESRLDALNLDRYCPQHVNHQHLLLMGAMNALMPDKSQFNKRKTANQTANLDATTKENFKFRGVTVCQKFFFYAFGCGIKRFNNVWRQFKNKGITPTTHENAASSKSLVRVTSTADLCKAAVTFILHFAQENALQLPGRNIKTIKPDAASVYQDLFLLPNQSNLGRREIYKRYQHASEEAHQEAVSYALWTELWDLQCSHVLTVGNQMELCNHCRSYHQLILQNSSATTSVNLNQPAHNESEMMKRALEYAIHLNLVQTEVKCFRETVDSCKAQYEALVQRHKTDFSSALRASFLAELPAMHYSIDWFSTISLPITGGSGSFAGSSIHFHSAYQVALFGVAIEPLRQYLLYIVPEFIAHNQSALPSLTISLLEHALSVAGPFKENKALIDCLNGSLDQAKSALLIAYLSWRTLVGKHDCISLNFLPPGHLHTWNDLFMGALKKRLRNSTVTSLADIKTIAESCAIEKIESASSGESSESNSTNDLPSDEAPAQLTQQRKSLIRAFLVGDDTESVTLPLYDWANKLTPICKLSSEVLQAHNHFKVDIDSPGYVLCNLRTSYAQDPNATTTQVVSHSYRLVSNDVIIRLDAEMPSKLHLDPLPLERRFYLHRTIKPYVEAAEKLKTAKRKKMKNADLQKEATNVQAISLISKLWAVDEHLLVNESDIEINSLTPFKLKRKLKNQNKEKANEKKVAPRCSYCSELGHRESSFGNVSCPKKKLDGTMSTTSAATVNKPLLPHVSLFDEENYENQDIDFELDETVFNGIVSEAEDIQQQQQQLLNQQNQLHNYEQNSPLTTITFLE